MEDVILAILPVGEACLVAGRLLDRLGWLDDFINLWSGSLALLTTILGLIGGGEVHAVWVDNLGFFLKVEGLLMILDLGLSQLAIVILLVV